MKYTLDINNRPFKAIQSGVKKIEGRTTTPWDKTPYYKLQKGDMILFINNMTREKMEAEILFVHHYSDTKSMLETEGLENVLSGKPKTTEHGIQSYNEIEGYKEGIRRNGIYAIGLELL